MHHHSSFQRLLRDVHAATQHVGMLPQYEEAGRMILGLQLLLAILNRGRSMHEQRWSATAAAEAIVRALHQRLRPTRALQAGGGRRNMLWSAYLPVATALTN